MLTLDNVLESWVMVLLKEMYLKSFTQAQNTQMAILLLFDFDLVIDIYVIVINRYVMLMYDNIVQGLKMMKIIIIPRSQ